MGISIFGWLDKIPAWNDLPYPTKSALLRAMKAGLSVAVGILLAAATQGILYPAGWGPGVTLIITMLLQAVDKYLRENEIAKGVDSGERGFPAPDAPPDEASQ